MFGPYVREMTNSLLTYNIQIVVHVLQTLRRGNDHAKGVQFGDQIGKLGILASQAEPADLLVLAATDGRADDLDTDHWMKWVGNVVF